MNGLTADQLIRRMFDTQTPRSGAIDPDGPHCDDTLTNGVPSFNGFPRRCPTPESKLAAVQNLAGQFFTLGLMNRFDQAPEDGSNCGQYRMVFAHHDGETSASTQVRRHLIFEAVLPNPNPSLGLAACRPVAQFWASLSAIDSMDERRAQLEKFFVQGLDGFAPTSLRTEKRDHQRASASIQSSKSNSSPTECRCSQTSCATARRRCTRSSGVRALLRSRNADELFLLMNRLLPIATCLLSIIGLIG